MARRVVVAFDKFRGSATAAELVSRTAQVARAAGWEATELPLADGGEGSLEVLGGPNKRTTVAGPLGDPVEAGWRLEGRQAFIEMAAASGLIVAGGAEHNDPLLADTRGTGQLIAAAVELGARQVSVLLGGSATTDGGWGALGTMPPAARMKEIDLVVACDVRTRFTDAARVFGPQKGATPAQVRLLTRRLERLVDVYRDQFGVDLTDVDGAGAAGGLAGALVAVGGRIESGFDVIAEWVGLDTRLEGADLVITGEGRLDDESFNGKVVGGVRKWAHDVGVPVLAVVGQVAEGTVIPDDLDVVALADVVGLDRAMVDPFGPLEDIVRRRLAG